MAGVHLKDLLDLEVDDNQDVANEKKCTEDIKPADIPYEKYMEVVKENEDLKEIIVKLVKKLNDCKFFD